MSNGSSEAARDRLVAAEELADAARDRTASVKAVAYRTISQAKSDLRTAANRGAVWRVIELVVQYKPPTLGTFFYLLVLVVGLTYTFGYYTNYSEVRIFGLFDTPDFLLSAFGNLKALLIALASPLPVLLLLGVSYVLIIREQAYRRPRGERFIPAFWVVVPLFVASFVIPLLVPYHYGKEDGKAAMDNPRFVRFAIRSDSPQSATRLPSFDRTILLGTTSSYHIFYECAHAGRPCEDGRPFIVPTANLSSVAYNLSEPDEAGAESNGEKPKGGTELEQRVSVLAHEVKNLRDTVVRLGVPPEVMTALVSLTERVGVLIGHVETDQVTWSNLATEAARLNGSVVKLNQRLPELVAGGAGIGEAVRSVMTEVEKLEQRIAALGEGACLESLRSLDVVGPFPLGEAESGGERVEEQLERVANSLKGRLPERLLLVGRVDGKRLSDEGMSRYRWDSGLAAARAEWVRDELKKRADDADVNEVIEQALLLTSGPVVVDSSSQVDRIVEVWRC